MKKQGLKLTGKVLAGLVLFSGITAVPTKAIDVKPAAVDVNVKNVKASVYEKEGHFYAKLVADKEVANVVARITTETKAQFLIKRDIIKAGEEVVVELDLAAQVPTRKLPHTGVKKESFNTVTELAGHTFKIAVSYEVATDEVKAQQKANNDQKKKIEEDLKNNTKVEKTEEPTNVPSISDLKKDPNAKAEQPKTADTAKPAETPKPNTPVNVAPSTTPGGVLNTVATPGTSGFRSVMLNNPKTETKTEVKTETKSEAKTEATKQTTQAAATTPVATTFEEQVKQSFIKQLNQLRAKNGLPQLAQNAALNNATAARANYVANNGGVHAGVHGSGGSLEKAAATNAGFPGADSILYNVVQVGNSGTADQVAYQLLYELFSEEHNVTPAHKYGHRNTLLSNTSSLVGVGVNISNGYVTLVQHQDNFGGYNGSTPTPGVFLDGATHIK
ncbi:CAP domain-containing protein [uncultured Gemella sp.]|uniref:CAP domain-containing protein n=1 Tax=uncultured Gemella sp. TaxID=254352 RepID=UPI0025E903DE|nr:CAP domain-containing protein [uncultured Gemella sp.]